VVFTTSLPLPTGDVHCPIGVLVQLQAPYEGSAPVPRIAGGANVEDLTGVQGRIQEGEAQEARAPPPKPQVIFYNTTSLCTILQVYRHYSSIQETCFIRPGCP